MSSFMKICSSGNWVVPCRQTDRNDKTNSCFSQFCGHAYEVLLIRNILQEICAVHS